MKTLLTEVAAQEKLKKALDASIKHWERLQDRAGRIDGSTCALCKVCKEPCACAIKTEDGDTVSCPLVEYGMECSPEYASPWADISELIKQPSVFNQTSAFNYYLPSVSAFNYYLPSVKERSEELKENVAVMLMCLYLIREAEGG
jgi:hypothetical protein